MTRLAMRLVLFLPVGLVLLTTNRVSSQDPSPSLSLSGQVDDLLSSSSSPSATTSKCASPVNNGKRVVCFYRVEDEFRPYDLNPCLCTHIVYSYVAVKENFAFIAGKKGDLRYLSALRERNPSVKLMVSLRPAGSAFTLEDPGNITYPLPPSNTLRHRFAKRIRDFLTRHNLDGIDLDYEYFKHDKHSNNHKRDYLISVIQAVSSHIRQDKSPFILSLTTSRYPRNLADYYDFSELHKHVDFVNIPAFNFDQDGKSLVHPAKMHGVSQMENMDAIIDLAFALGLPPPQLVVGVPTFGTLYRLSNTNLTTPGSPSISWKANNQPITTISHAKICEVRDKANWTLEREKDLTSPYIFANDKWIGFDDEISIRLKAKYILLRQASGLAFFHVNEDDPGNQCRLGAYPLIQSAFEVFQQARDVRPVSVQSYSLLYSNASQQYLTAFLNIVEKHGKVERFVEQDESDENAAQLLPCTHNGYHRHPEDCSRFYRCLKLDQTDRQTQKFQYNCPNGLVFDESYQICNWPSWSASCIGSGEITHSIRKSYVCKKVGYFQDDENCEYFHYCSDVGGGRSMASYEFKCPFELGFDQEQLQCNWKWLVKGCQYIPPEERVEKDLQQILPQSVQPAAGVNSLHNSRDADVLDVQASRVSQIFEEMADQEDEPDETIEEFERRSDDGAHYDANKIMTHLQKQFNLLRLLQPRVQSEGGSNTPTANQSRLTMLTNYISKLIDRFATLKLGNLFKPAQSRSDKQQTGHWLNPFNHIKIPKLKSFRKAKKFSSDAKKIDKKTFKIPKLSSKFGRGKKKKAEEEKKLKLGSPLPVAKVPQASFAPAALHNMYTPFGNDMMLVEESVHLPQFAKAPGAMGFNGARPIMRQPKPFYRPSMLSVSESSANPVHIPLQKQQQNQFNNKNVRVQPKLRNNQQAPRHAKKPKNVREHLDVHGDRHLVNNLNDYQVAGSSFAINTLGGQPPARPQTVRYPLPSPISSNYFYHNPPPPLKPEVKPASVGSTRAHAAPPPPPSPILASAFPDPFRPNRHSYGLPSVNIRYTYDNEQKVNKTKPVAQPLPAPAIHSHSAKPVKPVKLETTRFNFPDGGSADAQLENFLRDQFIPQPAAPKFESLAKPTAKPRPKPVNPTSSFSLPSSRPKQQVPANRFQQFAPSHLDPFKEEREKFFSSDLQPKPKPQQPARVAQKPKSHINYKLTPISDDIFELDNPAHSGETGGEEDEPKLAAEAPQDTMVSSPRDQITQAIHKANKFEYGRIPQKPVYKYESYEWTTPSSLKNDKVKVDFNLMTPKDVNEEVDKRKYLFSQFSTYKPEVPVKLNANNLFADLGDVFKNSPNDSYHERFVSRAPSTTTESSWLGMNKNDTKEYIMLMLNNYKNSQNQFDDQLREIIGSNFDLGKVYNVDSGDGAQALLALLPKDVQDSLPQAPKPFVYKGAQALDDKDIHKIDISKPDSQLLSSIIKKVRAELDESKQLLPGTDELEDLVPATRQNVGRRIPSDSGGKNNAFNYPIVSDIIIPVVTDKPEDELAPITDRPWYQQLAPINNKHTEPIEETVYEFHDQKANRDKNNNDHAYEIIKEDTPVLKPVTTTTIQPTREMYVTRPTTTTTTTTQAPTTSKPQKPVRRPNLRRKQEYGSRQTFAYGSGPEVLPKVQTSSVAPSTTAAPSPSVETQQNQNNFGKKLNRQRDGDSYAEVVSTEKPPFFYEEEVPKFSDLIYPETQNNHRSKPVNRNRKVTSTTSTTSSPAVAERLAPALVAENHYYPDSTIHNLKPDRTGIPESACTRAGIFQHPNDCNKYYECYWDKHINKFTLQPFECPVKLAFDSRIIGCGSPNDPTVCVQY